MPRFKTLITNPFTLDDPRIQTIPETGCWLWVGFINEFGYGKATVKSGSTAAHRRVYERLVGPIPEGMVLDHLCRVRSCVNPDHLRVVTRTVNVLENSLCNAAKNLQKTVCFRCGGPLSPDPYKYKRPSRKCKPCARAAEKAWRQRKRAEWRAVGACSGCGRPTTGRSRCEECRRKGIEWYARVGSAKKRARKAKLRAEGFDVR